MSENMDNNLQNDIDEIETIVFDTDEGQVEFYILEETKLAGENYILVTDELEGEEGSFLILKEDSSDDDFVSYSIVEDEKENEALISIFNELLDDIDLEV